MSGASFTDLTNKILSRGIDAYSSKANIPDGFVEDMENFDTNASGLVSKRKGFVSESGWLPIRVTRVTRSNHDIKFQLDSSQSIDLSTTSLGPILTYGRLSSGITTTSTNLSTTNDCAWWSTVTLDNTDIVLSGANTISKSVADHGISSNQVFIGIASVDNDSNSNTTWVADEVAINTSTYAIDIDVTAITEGEVYTYVSDMTAEAGTTYVHTLTGSTSESILSSTHNLSNYFIQVRCYNTSGGEYIEVIPDTLTINATNGTVAFTFDTSVTGIAILHAVPIANVQISSAVAGTQTITIPSPGSPWNFVDIYAYNTSSLLYDNVIPDSISYDASTDILSIEYTMSTASEAVEIYWENASVVNNSIKVVDATGGNETWADTEPQLTIWGLSHTDMYLVPENRGGHVNHIDQYRRVAENRLIAGLGGNIFASRTQDEVGTTYCMPTSYVDLRSRAASDVNLAPLFQSTAITRTRGSVVDATAVVGNKVTITSATYVSSTATDYTLSFDSAATITGKVDTNDEFVVTGMPYAALNGTFKFVSVSNDATTAPVLRLYNTAGNARYNCTATTGKVGCFTDYLPLSASNHTALLPGDIAVGEMIGSGLSVTVVDKVGDNVYLRGITEGIVYPENVRASFNSTRALICLRDADGQEAVDNFVAGDMVTITGIDHPVRVVRVGAGGIDLAASIVGDGTTATVTHDLDLAAEVGDRVIISGSPIPEFNGIITISAINSTSEFEYLSEGVGTDSSLATLIYARVLELESSVFVSDYQSGTEVSVNSRWIPIEAPEDSYDLTEANYRKHFDTNNYDNQPTLRSVMVGDNTYFVNGSDEVMKFDGENIYRAGLFRWQPHLFTQIDTTTGSIVPISTAVTVANGGTNGNVFTAATVTEAGMFGVGDRIQDSKDSAYYTVVEIDEVNGFIEVDVEITGDHTTGGTLTTVAVYNYYFRLNAIDANNNVIASAITSSGGDCQVELGVAGQIKHRLIGMPAWDIYDYDRIEAQMYRTKADSLGPFYLIQTTKVDFDNYDGYIDFTDSTPDFTLTTADLDQVNSALLGAELGTGWDEPMRATSITSAGNRLILGNITGYPRFDITINKKATSTAVTAANLHGKIFTFRKDSASTSTTTDMTNVVNYEFLDAATATTSKDIYPSTFTFLDADVTIDTTNTITEASHGLQTGHKIQLTTTGVLPTGLNLATDYYVIRVDANTIKLASSLANAASSTPVVISAAAGGGTHTVVPQSGIATTATNFTINSVAHGLAAGDWVYLYHAAAGLVNDLTFAGWWQISSAATNTFTIAMTNHRRTTTGGNANDVDSYIVATAPADVPVLLGTDGNYNNKYGNISTTYESKAVLRLANAINASMRVCDVAVETSFTPWLMAGAGNDFSRGQIVIRQPKVFSTTAEVVLPTVASSATFDLYVHGIRRSSAEVVSTSTPLFPSRVLISYPNFAEIFDNPEAYQDISSGSAVDINASDGQSVSTVITFFGESTFGAAQLSDATVVFKENSIYLLDPASQQYQKIDSRGLGCSAPRSVSATKNGIMFANRSGIYRLNRDMTISHVGKYQERYWKRTVHLDQIAEFTGHQYAAGRKYKLSVPVNEDLYCSKVLVYDHDSEGMQQEFGSWSRYSNHNATGWCNLQNDAYFGTVDGDVFKIRNLNVASDFRDEAAAITSTLTTRGDDFGLPGIRKLIGQAVVNLQLDTTNVTNLTITSSVDLKDVYVAAGSITASRADDPYVTAGVSLANRRGTNISLKLSHSTVDEDVQLTGISFKVARLGSEGIKQTADFT